MMTTSTIAPTSATSAGSARATAPADHPGRWIGGILGVLASLALVPIALLLEQQPTSSSLPGLANMGLLGAPIGFVLGRHFFPSARSGGWTMALSVGIVIGWAAPPLGAIALVVGPLLLPTQPGEPWRNPTELLLYLALAIPFSFIAAIITVPVGLAWGLLVGLVPDAVPQQLRVPRPLERLGVRHAAIVVATVLGLLTARHPMDA